MTQWPHGDSRSGTETTLPQALVDIELEREVGLAYRTVGYLSSKHGSKVSS